MKGEALRQTEKTMRTAEVQPDRDVGRERSGPEPSVRDREPSVLERDGEAGMDFGL